MVGTFACSSTSSSVSPAGPPVYCVPQQILHYRRFLRSPTTQKVNQDVRRRAGVRLQWVGAGQVGITGRQTPAAKSLIRPNTLLRKEKRWIHWQRVVWLSGIGADGSLLTATAAIFAKAGFGQLAEPAHPEQKLLGLADRGGRVHRVRVLRCLSLQTVVGEFQGRENPRGRGQADVAHVAASTPRPDQASGV